MVSSISNNISQISLLNATNAFKNIQSKIQEEQAPQIQEDNLKLDNDFQLEGMNIDEIKEFATTVGENNLSNEDIKYGLKYGRSVIVDYSV